MRYRIKTILKQSIPVLIATIIISIIAGFVLNGNENVLKSVPGMLIILPAFLNMGGSLSGVLSSRLSSGLHLGYISPKLHRTKFLKRNLISTYITGFISFLALGFFAGLVNFYLGLSTNILIYAIIVSLAGFITLVTLSLLSVLFSYYTWSKGIDPDNVVIPILTSMGDIIGVFFLFYILSVVI